VADDGSFTLPPAQTVRTTVPKYVAALSSDVGMANAARAEFLGARSKLSLGSWK